ncbi:hypothetical protein ABVK25_000964 [Lepraria finkii]|uniref:BAH domain-containing protein n=1 Tax=Lepraria finkii TaxID=1340010 RepID=A0ABR4BRD2_9LECA
MPHSTRKPSEKSITKAERARQYLIEGGVTREDSDDELGLEDYPWEWIYSSEPGSESDIIGARMGDFQCMIGDCVLLKAEGNGEAWIGLICHFEEDEEDSEKMANFMWFSTDREIRNKQKKRTDALANEVYITPSWDNNPLTSINGRATVVSRKTFEKRYPNGKVPRSSKDYGKIFICRRGCNTRTATYTDEFVWDDVYQSADDILPLIERIQNQTKATRKRKKKRRRRSRRMGSHESRSTRRAQNTQQETKILPCRNPNLQKPHPPLDSQPQPTNAL